MARPRTYTEDRVATAVRLPVSIHRRLHQEAADRDVSANLLVTRAVTEFLNQLTPADAAPRQPGREPWSATSETAGEITWEIDA